MAEKQTVWERRGFPESIMVRLPEGALKAINERAREAGKTQADWVRGVLFTACYDGEA